MMVTESLDKYDLGDLFGDSVKTFLYGNSKLSPPATKIFCCLQSSLSRTVNNFLV